MVKGIIFDLDMCILDTRTLGKHAIDPLLKTIYSSSLHNDIKKQINNALWTTNLEDVIDLFKIPDDIAERMRKVYRNLEVPDDIQTFGDENCLKSLYPIKILVTSGYKKFQETKIKKLGIAPLFDEIIIDALDYPEKRKGKIKIFQEILENRKWLPTETLAVGDNPHSELGAAKTLGIKTAQTLRPTIEKWADADYHIASLRELAALI